MLLALSCAATLACSSGGDGGDPGGIMNQPAASTLSARVDGEQFTARAPYFELWGSNDSAVRIRVSNSSGEELRVEFPVPSMVPDSWALDGFSTYAHMLLFLPADGYRHPWYACEHSGSVRVTSYSGDRIQGTFSFDASNRVVNDECTGAIIQIRSGVFDLTLRQ